MVASPPEPHFNGPEYLPERDHERLKTQFDRILGLMVDGEWRTHAEIHEETRDPLPSISAQLRHARKARFGSYVVERRSREGRPGLYEYRVLPPGSRSEYPTTYRGGGRVPITTVDLASGVRSKACSLFREMSAEGAPDGWLAQLDEVCVQLHHLCEELED